MSAAEQLRDLVSLQAAIKSEMSVVELYLANEDRWNYEMKRETKNLERQQARVERLRAYRERGHEMLMEWEQKLCDLKQEAVQLRNKAAIEKLRETYRRLNELQSGLSQETLDAIAAQVVVKAAVQELEDEDTEQAVQEYEERQ